MAVNWTPAAGPAQCFLVGSLLVLIGIALPVVRTKLGKSAGFDGAPTLVELYNEGKGYQGTRIDISYDIRGGCPGPAHRGPPRLPVISVTRVIYW